MAFTRQGGGKNRTSEEHKATTVGQYSELSRKLQGMDVMVWKPNLPMILKANWSFCYSDKQKPNKTVVKLKITYKVYKMNFL